MKQNINRTAPFGEPQENENPAASQLREAFEENQALRADRDALKSELDAMTNQRNVAIARVALLESQGKTIQVSGGKNKDGSYTLPIILNPDLVPALEAQWEGMGPIGLSFEEYIRDQVIMPSIEMAQGAF